MFGVPSVAQWDQWRLGSTGTWVQSPPWHRGLRIQHCRNCGLSHNNSSDLIPDPGTSSATERPKKKTKNKKQKTNFSAMFNNLKLLQYNKVVNISI